MSARLLLALACLIPAAAQAETAKAAADKPRRIVNAVVYGDDPCPNSRPNEIVVCARQPEAERYRIPRRFRDEPSPAAAAQAWATRVDTIEEVNRAGLPNSCSPVGAGGQTGCTMEMLRRWLAEKQAMRVVP